MSANEKLCMPDMTTRPNDCIAFYKTGLLLSALLCLATPLTWASPANAFTIFGITLFGDKNETDIDVIDPVPYSIRIDTNDADATLTEVLNDSSLLKRDEGTPASGDLGLVIKARDDRDRLVAALYENARYGGTVTVTVNGIDINDLPPDPDFPRSGPIPVEIRVQPGPVFTLGSIALKEDAARLNPADYDLVPGGDAGSLNILKAGDRIVADLKAEGRPLARVTSRDVVADHETRTLDVTIVAKSGPVADLGDVSVSGTQKVNSGFVQRYSRLRPGDRYAPEEIRKSAERLRKLGVFSSVTIREAEELAADGSLPLQIEVSEGKHRYFGVGATVSSIDGLGLEGYWGHRNLFGNAESLRIEGSVGRLGDTRDLKELDYAAGIIFSKPGAFFPAATLNASIRAATQDTTSYDVASITGLTSLSYEITDEDTVSGGISLQWADIEDAFGRRRYLTLSTPFDYVRDTRDNALDATEGYRLSANATPSYDIFGSTFFASFEGSASAYYGIGQDDRVVFAGRVAAGTLFDTGSLADIPATSRFFAGGGGSVRGYAYEEISPYDAKGDATGGRSYALGSLEARIKVTDSIGIVPFIDAGTVSAVNYPDFQDIRMGAGIGLRYATPFGPIRLDFAVPLDRYPGGSQYGIYAGIGQSF